MARVERLREVGVDVSRYSHGRWRESQAARWVERQVGLLASCVSRGNSEATRFTAPTLIRVRVVSIDHRGLLSGHKPRYFLIATK
jgi:hypothetical protein